MESRSDKSLELCPENTHEDSRSRCRAALTARSLRLLYVGGAAIGNNAQRSPLINTKQLDNKSPFELVFLFARHVRTADLLTIYVERRQTKQLKENYCALLSFRREESL